MSLPNGWRDRTLRLILNNLHFVGLVLVVLLMTQNYYAQQISTEQLRDRIAHEESLRNTMWMNLFVQRATIKMISGDTKQGLELIHSIPDFLQHTNDQHLRQQLAQIQEVFESQKDLARKSEQISAQLSTEETRLRSELQQHNERTMASQEDRRMRSNVTYGLFLFYLFLLGSIMAHKNESEVLLSESERRQRTLAEASFEGLVLLSNGAITQVNPAFEQMLGLEHNAAVGHRLQEYLVGHLQDENSPHFALELDSKYFIKQADGQLPVELSVRETQVDDQLLQIVAIRDLSDRQRREQMSLEKDAAERANQSKSIFLANMSHELRTPMHGILSFARFGQQRINSVSTPVLKSYFDEIYESGSRLMSLLNDLLDLSKLEAGKINYDLRPESLVDLAHSVLSEVKAFAEEKQIRVEIKAAPSLSAGMMDSFRINQVLRNLIINALKYSDPSTSVTLHLGEDRTHLVCDVENHGLGIPEAELEAIFDKFVQSTNTRSNAGGTGLGLAICKEIVVQHGGRIWASSPSHKQTVFTFTLPKAVAA